MDRTNPEAPDGAAARRDPAAPEEPGAPQAERRPRPVETDGGSDLVVIVTVTRTGGIAGMRRIWRAEAGEDQARPWIALIEECPWDAARLGGFVKGADRFMWAVDARCGKDERQAELADSDVRGPWRELIDAVREEGSPVPSGRG